MKKIILSLGMLVFFCNITSASLLGELKNQIIDQTRITALEKGGPSMLYDLADGTGGAFKVGATDHVLTNRFVQADVSWLGGTDGHTSGIGILGPSIIITDALQYYFPTSISLLKILIPRQLENVWIGIGAGWEIDSWKTHWAVSLGKNF